DAFGNSFPVDVRKDMAVGYLKELIKKKKESDLNNISADSLKLWSVNIPTEGKDLETKIYAENIKEQYQAKTLTSLLASSILQPLDVKFPTHKFYDRNQALNSMLKVARYNYEGRSRPDHKDHGFILIPGGIGIGKTRMGWESKNLSSILSTRDDNTEFVEALKDPCYVFIDLNSEYKYITGFDDVEDSNVRIGTRVAVASGLVPECYRLHKLIATNNPKLFELPNVISEILQRRFKMKQRSVEAIIIHLDEYQLYIDDAKLYQQLSWIKSHEFFKSMLREIGSVMRGNNMKDEYDRKYFIVPICTGTSAIDVHFLPTEYTQEILELKPLNYVSAKSMFLDKYDYSKQTTDQGRDLVMQNLKSHHSSDLNNDDVEKLSADFCNFVLNQQHFHIAMFDTGFIPKFIDDLLNSSTLKSYFDWGNKLFTKISGRNVTKVGNNPGDWKNLDDIRTVISFGLTGHHVTRDFLLPSRTSIGELERSGLIYLFNTKDEWYTIVMPFMLLKVLNNKLLISNVEPVFPDHLLLIPTHVFPWQWEDFELLYGHFQNALIDSLIKVKESKLLSINHIIELLQLKLEKETHDNTILQINDEIKKNNINLIDETNMSWQLSDIFRGALGADTLLQRKVRLHNLKVFTESKKFLATTDDVASFDKSVLCDYNVTCSLEEGIFRCYKGNANIDHRWILDSADNGKKLAIFSQIKYSERGVITKMSTSDIKGWYDITMKSIENYMNDYDVVLVLFTNRKCTGKINIETMPHLLLIYPENLEKYLSPTFAHRGLVDRPGENNH
ncbi:18335_t:CDS:2, partial [Acaulospora morrowiae]